MHSRRLPVLAWVIGLAMGPFAAHAAIVNAPLPTNAYITFGGYDWAWAFPIAPDGVFGQGSTSSIYFIDLSYQAQFGWRLPTAAELLGAPDAIDFEFAGANVKAAGTGIDPVSGAFFEAGNGSVLHLGADAACATPYFSTFYRDCDWSNGRGITSADWWNPGKGYGGGVGKQLGSVDTLVIRNTTTGTPLAEPGSLALMAFALTALQALRRRA